MLIDGCARHVVSELPRCFFDPSSATSLGMKRRQSNRRGRVVTGLLRRGLTPVTRVGSVVGGPLLFAFLEYGCGPPDTSVVLDNDYPSSAAAPIVVYQAVWQAVTFTTPVPPGSSSAPQSTVPASSNTAYAVLAPGWPTDASTPPTSLVVVQSQSGFSVHLDDTLHIPVDDTTFVGNCAAGSILSQSQADFITQLVFPTIFAGLEYDAATCTTTAVGDGGGEGGAGSGSGDGGPEAASDAGGEGGDS
jgi:hypothetical protein